MTRGYECGQLDATTLGYYFAVRHCFGFKFLDGAVAGAVFVGLISAACGKRPLDLAQGADRNVLLITIDTLRGDALGCDGGPARTPNIDAIAAGGLRFSFAHAQAVVTLPSHASILTGLYPFQHGYRENSGYRLTPGVQTLASRLKATGFSTGAFVAAFPLDARFGLTPGFDTYDGRFDDVGSGAEFLLPERPAPVVVDRAVRWIQQRDGRWFAWVHLYDPHAPYRPPPPFDREYAAQPYYGEVAAADQALGPLLSAARASSRSTLVVLTGDHGESLGEHGELTHGLFAYESDAASSADHRGASEGRRGSVGPAGQVGRVGRRGRPISRRGTSTSFRRFSTCWASRCRRICRATPCGRVPIATAAPCAPPTSRRWNRRSTSASHRSTACSSAGTSSSACRCRNCTTSARIAARPPTSSIAWPIAPAC